MPAAKKARDLEAEIAFLTRALKAPTLRESVERLAERARAETWSHEEFLVACLQREVSARESHGGEGRIRAARFPGRKSLEEFDYDHARGLKRDVIAHLGTLDFAAPEVFRGQLSDRTDQYSLAVSYYLLRTGRLPFRDTPTSFTPTYSRGQPDLSLLPAGERVILAKALSV